jgi:hypothetical protein
MALRQHDVVGLYVSVNDVVLMSVAQGVNDITKDTDRLGNREFAFLRELVPKRLTFDIRHDVVQVGGRTDRRTGGRWFLGCSGIQKWQDVGVVEVRGNFDFAVKPISTEGLSELWTEYLDRDLAVVLYVQSEIDRRHAATAEFSLDGVVVGEGGLQAVEGVSH